MSTGATPAGTTASDSTPLVPAGSRVVLCLGSGGVGKTTTSAALALALAARGERVMVLTIDPARRLADALGLGGQLTNDPTLVTDLGDRDTPSGSGGGGGQVWAAMLDAGETFRAVIEAEASSAAQAERILGNRLFRNLTTTLSGTNEYMAAERLHQLDGDPRFDRIVVDTPPSRHVLDFLDSPGRLSRFVDHRLYRSLLAPRRIGVLRPLTAASRAAMRLLANLVGASLVDDVITFFADFEGMDEGFQRRARAIDALLSGPDTTYLLVTAPRTDRLAEAAWILDNLERRGRRANGLVVNRVLPFASPDASDDGGVDLDRLPTPLAHNLDQLRTMADQERALIVPLAARVQASQPGDEPVPIVELPEQLVPVHDLGSLRALAELL